MPDTKHDGEQSVRDRAYFIWVREGRPEGRAHDHWTRAISEALRPPPGPRVEPLAEEDEEEKVLAGRLDVNLPALLTRDVPGG